MPVHKKFPALGRGLDALIDTADEIHTSGSSSINEIPVDKIIPNPNQPRHEFDEDALEELAESIRQLGIVQPITLRQMDDESYEIIAGERRWRASKLAGLTTVPAYVRTANDENMMQMALVENIQREDLNAIEVALAYQKLIEQYHLTHGGQRLAPPQTPSPRAAGSAQQIHRPRPCPRHSRSARAQRDAETVQRSAGTRLQRSTSGGNGKGPQRWRDCKER